MLNRRLVRKEDADFHFEVMGHLIHQFGSPPRPPVPSLLHKTPGLETLSWTDLDTRSVYDWAKDNFNAIQSTCNMSDYELELIPAGDGFDADPLTATRRLEALAAGHIPYHNSSATPIFYDPRDCTEPGHFVAKIVLQLAELRLEGFETKTETTNLMQRMATLTAAVFNRQGFVLANLPQDVSAYLAMDEDIRTVPHRVIINSICFATCLALRVRRQSTEQIIGTYGTRMTKSLRKKIHLACRQIDTDVEGLAVLQMLSDRKASPQMRRFSA